MPELVSFSMLNAGILVRQPLYMPVHISRPLQTVAAGISRQTARRLTHLWARTHLHLS